MSLKREHPLQHQYPASGKDSCALCNSITPVRVYYRQNGMSITYKLCQQSCLTHHKCVPYPRIFGPNSSINVSPKTLLSGTMWPIPGVRSQTQFRFLPLLGCRAATCLLSKLPACILCPVRNQTLLLIYLRSAVSFAPWPAKQYPAAGCTSLPTSKLCAWSSLGCSSD